MFTLQLLKTCPESFVEGKSDVVIVPTEPPPPPPPPPQAVTIIQMPL